MQIVIGTFHVPNSADGMCQYILDNYYFKYDYSYYLFIFI